MKKIELQVDVGNVVALGDPQFVAGTAFLPDGPLTDPPLVIFASPGGGYSRGYFDMHFKGRDGYSEAEYHTARGLIFVAQDHLGVGDSSIDHAHDLTVEMIADGAHAFVGYVLEQLKQGTLEAQCAPVKNPVVIGIGQSLGA